MTFTRLVLHNVGVKKLRLALTALAVAIGVVTVVSLGVVTSSLKTSELAIMQPGRADFTIAQKSVADLLASSIDQAQTAADRRRAGRRQRRRGPHRNDTAERRQPAVPGDRDRPLATDELRRDRRDRTAVRALRRQRDPPRMARRRRTSARASAIISSSTTPPTRSWASTRPGNPSATPVRCCRWSRSRPTNASPTS